MCGGGGGGGGDVAPPVYKSRDGQSFEDPNQAADRDRKLQLAAAFGYNEDTGRQAKVVSGKEDGIDAWLSQLDPSIKQKFDDYDKQGLTAADFRSEKRLSDQEAQAKQAEMDRKSGISSGRLAVDNTLAGFDDKYFDGIAKTVESYYQPQLDEQFNDAGKQLTYKLGRQGILKSTAANDRRTKLQGKYDIERAGITNKAADAAAQARENVNSVKTQLYNYAESSADPAAVSARVAGENARLRSFAPETTPLGQVFADYITPATTTIGNGLLAEAKGYQGFGTGLFDNKKSTTQNVVR